MRKLIDIKPEFVRQIAVLAIKERRRGKLDSKNFIEDLLESYVQSKNLTQ